MAITREAQDWITITPDGVFEHRRAVQIFEDGELIGEKNHRGTYPPITDPATMPPKLRAIADVVWTPAVVQAYRDKLAAQPPRPV